jgi:hypothetical protein
MYDCVIFMYRNTKHATLYPEGENIKIQKITSTSLYARLYDVTTGTVTSVSLSVTLFSSTPIHHETCSEIYITVNH